MRLTRVFSPQRLQSGRQLRLEAGAANHLLRVLRVRAGDSLTLFDGLGGEYSAAVADIRRDEVVVSVGEHRAIERESATRVTLAQGISRGERMDWVIQKATELGVTHIVPIFTARSLVQLDSSQAGRKLQHWRAIAVGACEQSGRNRVPEIDNPIALHAFLERPLAAEMRLLLSPEGRELPNARWVAHIVVLIGPEGGLSCAEQQAAAACHFSSVKLGPRILRTETAAVAALSVLQHRFGDL